MEFPQISLPHKPIEQSLASLYGESHLLVSGLHPSAPSKFPPSNRHNHEARNLHARGPAHWQCHQEKNYIHLTRMDAIGGDLSPATSHTNEQHQKWTYCHGNSNQWNFNLIISYRNESFNITF